MVRKTVEWNKQAKKAVHQWPLSVKLNLGQELTRAELGAYPRSGEALTDVGPKVHAIRLDGDKATYRLVYTVIIQAKVYVLHAFQKKAKTGKKTPQSEKEVAKKRYNELCKTILTVEAPRRTQ